jgi:integrase
MPAPKRSTPPRGLTPKFIEALQPEAKSYDLRDRGAIGLRLRVHSSGSKVFRYKLNSLHRTIVLGPFSPAEEPSPGFVSLKQAREWMEKVKWGRITGRLPEVEAELREHLRRPSTPEEAVQQDRNLFGAVVEEWFTDDINVNRKHPEDVRAILDRDIRPSLATRPLVEITTLECRDVVRRTVTRGAVAHAGKVLSTLKQFFNWAQANGYTDRTPAFPLRGRHLGVVENISDRALDEKEIPIFWRSLDQAVTRDDPAAQKIRPATAAALKVLLLTGVRSGELLKARWENVDLEARTWVIPVCDQKLTKRQERRAKPFVIPLAPTALDLFKQLRAVADALGNSVEEKRARVFVMASPESKTGHYDDKALGHALRRLVSGKRLVLPNGEISPHDLRRSFRTTLSRLQVPHWIIERALNHAAGKIVETYDRHDYFPERTEALAKLDAYVRRLLAPEQANVAFLPAREA